MQTDQAVIKVKVFKTRSKNFMCIIKVLCKTAVQTMNYGFHYLHLKQWFPSKTKFSSDLFLLIFGKTAFLEYKCVQEKKNYANVSTLSTIYI